jgi:flagellin-like hook-associated protein FlgL
MNDLMQRMRELALQGSSDTLSGNERAFIGKEVEQLTRQMVALSNTNYKGDYVFAGTETKTTPFPIETSSNSTLENYANREMAYFDASVIGADAPVQLRDAFNTDPITNIIPGTFKISSLDGGGVRRDWVEGRDFTINYTSGEITILSTGTDPAALTTDVSDGGTFAGPNYAFGTGFQISLEYISKGRDIYGDQVSIAGQIQREIETGIQMPINITGDELTRDPNTGIDLIGTLVRFGQNLIQNNRSGIETDIGNIDITMKNLLAAQSKNGARINRFETTADRNEMQFTETTRIQSDLEDADFAEVASKFSLAQTVYNAALQSAAKVIQPSLANFL